MTHGDDGGGGVQGYRYVHFVDSDAGSPEERPFDLREYEDFLARHKVLIGQPAISDKGRCVPGQQQAVRAERFGGSRGRRTTDRTTGADV